MPRIAQSALSTGQRTVSGTTVAGLSSECTRRHSVPVTRCLRHCILSRVSKHQADSWQGLSKTQNHKLASRHYRVVVPAERTVCVRIEQRAMVDWWILQSDRWWLVIRSAYVFSVLDGAIECPCVGWNWNDQRTTSVPLLSRVSFKTYDDDREKRFAEGKRNLWTDDHGVLPSFVEGFGPATQTSSNDNTKPKQECNLLKQVGSLSSHHHGAT